MTAVPSGPNRCTIQSPTTAKALGANVSAVASYSPLAQALSRDYDVVSAFDGREGLENALRFRPAVIITDIMMPNVSGDEMIAAMAGTPELRATPVLVLSAKADDRLRAIAGARCGPGPRRRQRHGWRRVAGRGG